MKTFSVNNYSAVNDSAKISRSSFKFLVSSFALLLAFGGTASAQWLIDGQRVQTLNLAVSDPQALYTDGTRELTAPITVARSLSQTTGALRIYAVENEAPFDYFMELATQDGLRFCSSHGASLLIGSPGDGLLLGPASVSQTQYGPFIDFETATLQGIEWKISQAPTTTGGIVSKGFADGRYLLRTTGITTNRVIQAGDTLVISNGLITAIIP